jgi:hypothetical protein
MSELFVKSAFAYCSFIHFLPTIGSFGTSSLEKLYGITIHEPNLLLLMTHRAILFGIVGSLLGVAVINKQFRKLAYFTGMTSMSSYIILASGSIKEYKFQIQRVYWIDMIGLFWLGGAAVVSMISKDDEKKI